MSAIAIERSGHCPNCSWPEHNRYVVHAVSWCPRIYASAWVDTNGMHSDGTIFFSKPSRPIEVGELIWLYDTGDGEDAPFATWARVERVQGRGYLAAVVGDRWCYAERGNG